MRTVLVISLGGSLVVPKDIDIDFLRKFKRLIIKHLKNKRFIIVVGGGFTARKYIDVLKKIGAKDVDRDWLGILATKMNAYLLKAIFKHYAHNKILSNPMERVKFKDILIASGWKPGFSTDYDAVLWARNYGANIIINLTDIDYVYNKDPKRFNDAKPIKKLNWKGYKRLICSKWKPGLKTPFDPVASMEAEKMDINVIVMKGDDLKNLNNFFNGSKFKGSIISNQKINNIGTVV